jgi:adenine-specific DNA methylase
LSQKSPFLLRERNPDVLTSIANLSNDEVFTPPTFANQMLDTVAKAWADSNDGANIWADKNVRFLDPFTKSGVFLREIVRRLSEGLEKEIPDLQDRINHIVSKQVFGMAITQLTALTTRRSVYCSKRANGKHSIATIFNDEEGSIWFNRTEHTWTGGAQKVITVDENGKEIEKKLGGKCKHCGASQSEYERDKTLESHAYALIHTEDPKKLIKEVFGEEMQFDVIIGNPPYQLDTGGSGRQAKPIYNLFVEQAKKLDPRFLCMVIPSRWFAGGMGLDEFRSNMLKDRQISQLVDYVDASEVFAGVDIPGGICYFLWESGRTGDCQVVNLVRGDEYKSVRPLDQFDTFVRYNPSVSILSKVLGSGEPSIVQIVSATRPFGLQTKDRPDGKGTIRLVSSAGEGLIESKRITAGKDLVGKWKVLTSKTSHDHGGNPDKHGTRRVLSRLEILEPNAVCTESYIVIGGFDTRVEAENCLSFLQTKFVRHLISILSFSQDITRERFRYVPLAQFGAKWTDELLYDKYGLDKSEIEYIEATIKPMGLENV